ncbi:Integral membrane protein [Candidatus Rhodobacter oscarellae]|uniref:Integral membrane protein n=1 Tax=Candidatus Rhodobacter oscarellae TaxID=1675527 RepID=A0A0J9E3K8_9RHOB|nr:DMT family transporter [Candidatus Rhodobacter lobularis]KMW56404.1 Integral membrane protein [Candidatus Rhodobacter lobularis]
MSSSNTPSVGDPTARPALGIAFVLVAMVCISVNDMTIKRLSGDYPLHQMVFVRSGLGIIVSMVFVYLEGGLAILRPRRPVLHIVRALMIVMANMAFFMGLAVMPLAEATALFFVAPLFITLLSVPLLGEKVGWRRLSAVLVGFLGVLVIVGPGRAAFAGVPLWVLALPVVAAFGYAMMQVLTRALRMTAKASAMAVYIQLTFVLVGGVMYLIAGDGRYAEGLENESLVFVLRAWAWPAPEDMWAFGVLGAMSAAIGYTLSQAYRLGDAATIAPYEYASLPLAIMWGWVIFGTLPGVSTALGILLILGSGVFVFIRARQVAATVQD